MLRLRRPKTEKLKVVVLGQASVGKTCFIDMFTEGKHFIRYSAVSHAPTQRRTIAHAGGTWSFSLMDMDLHDFNAPSYGKVLNTLLTNADGIVLLYDLTCASSFSAVTDDSYIHTWECRNFLFPNGSQTDTPMATKERFGCILVGNKRDAIIGENAAERQVCAQMADQWAASQGMRHLEISTNEGTEVDDALGALVDSILRARRMNEKDRAQSG